MRLIGLYLGTKYEVSRSNRFWDMDLGAPESLFDLEIWSFTLSQGHRKNASLNVNPVVLPSYQVWSRSVKWFRNYLKLKFSMLKFCPPDAGRLYVKWSPGSKTHKKHKISWFLKKKIFFWEKWRKQRVTKLILWLKKQKNKCLLLFVKCQAQG